MHTNKAYFITYASPHNLFSGTVFVDAECLTQAQDKFFSWVKKQEVYSHMWRLSFEIEEVFVIKAEDGTNA